MKCPVCKRSGLGCECLPDVSQHARELVERLGITPEVAWRMALDREAAERAARKRGGSDEG